MASRTGGSTSAPSHVLFLDESGDPVMQYADRSVPLRPEVFLLCGCLFDQASYNLLIIRLADLKRHHLGHSDVPLVSRQIRRHRGAFAFLDDAPRKIAFMEDIGALIRETPFTVFAAAIDKHRHWKRYRERAVSPYDLCLAFILERVTLCVGGQGAKVRVVAESRGRREDNALRLEFARLMHEGAYVSAERLRDCFLEPLEFWPKHQNVPGLQIADLVAYPLANRLCNPESRRVDFDIVLPKLHRAGKRVWGVGLKLFPNAKAADYGL